MKSDSYFQFLFIEFGMLSVTGGLGNGKRTMLGMNLLFRIMFRINEFSILNAKVIRFDNGIGYPT